MKKLLLLLLLLPGLAGCERPDPEHDDLALPTTGAQNAEMPAANGAAPPAPNINGTPLPAYTGTPTPDPPHPTAVPGGDTIHRVNPGETLGYIAQLYGRSVNDLLAANALAQADLLFVGQEITIPGQTAALIGTTFKIIPDSELVYGPAARGFDVRAFAERFNGRLLRYEEEVEGQLLAGPEIVSLVAHRYSVNPRLLLAALEYRAGWVTQPEGVSDVFVMGRVQNGAEGLYRQLSWAADQLNWGYYGRAEGGLHTFVLGDGTRIAYAAQINHGTAGVQRLLGSHSAATYESWLQDVGRDGLYAVFTQLFGNPFAYSIDPLWPSDLAQPPLELPWSSGETWYFTSGPHGGWASGSAWAALDFAPESDRLGCVSSDAWVRAMAGGVVTRSDFGAVVVDLDGDGYAGTGWAITYMHLEGRDRVAVGTRVQTGDALGHPSCEGGFSSGTHVHIARTYNGRWVAADGERPFNMGGWVSQGLGREYDGLLVRDGVSREACACRDEMNAITAD